MPGRSAGNQWVANRPLLRRLLWYREQLEKDGFTTAAAQMEFEIADRTVYRDLDYMRSLEWDLEYCRERRRWVLERPGTPLPVLSLREGEVVALLVAEEALRSYQGTPYAAALESAFNKIVALLDAPVSVPAPEGPLPRFAGPSPRPVPVEQYEQLVAACRGRRRLEIVYHSLARDEVVTRRVDPYHVFAFGGDWYLVAHDHHRGEFRTFALGARMREVRRVGETYAPDPEFALDRYLDEGFGIFRGGPVEEVRLRFTPAVARYLREKVWDDTEVKEDGPDGSLVLRMQVPLSGGLRRFVLGFGAEVEVLAPASLRADVAAEAARIAALYPVDRKETHDGSD